MAYSYPEDNQKNKNNRLERLSQKLEGFWVKTFDGKVIGKVINVVANAERKPELVIALKSQPSHHQKSFLLKSSLVKQVDLASRLLLVDRTPTMERFISQNNMASSSEPHPYSESLENPQLMDDSEATLPLSGTDQERKILDEHVIPLKAEKLVVERHRRKVGEVVVRKAIETHFVQVPVQQEKLIIEQVGDEYKQLAEIQLSEGKVTGIEGLNSLPEAQPSVNAEFLDAQSAREFLEAIAHLPHPNFERIRIQIVLQNSEQLATYQNLLNHYNP